MSGGRATSGGGPGPAETVERAPSLRALGRESGRASTRVVGAHTYVAGDDRPVGGPMAATVGTRIPIEAIASSESLDLGDPDAATAADLVRAWTIDTLLGARFVASGRDDIPAAIASMLTAAIHPGPWTIDPHVLQVFDKYGVLHADVAAPADSATDQPLEVELYAEQTKVLDLDPSQLEPWLDPGRIPMEGPLEFQVIAATCSNVRHLGDGMPFYS